MPPTQFKSGQSTLLELLAGDRVSTKLSIFIYGRDKKGISQFPFLGNPPALKLPFRLVG